MTRAATKRNVSFKKDLSFSRFDEDRGLREAEQYARTLETALRMALLPKEEWCCDRATD